MVAESALPTLFDKYTQVSTTHARKYGGTGLGLAICKNLVRKVSPSMVFITSNAQMLPGTSENYPKRWQVKVTPLCNCFVGLEAFIKQ
jgi:hypothetical protein